MSYKIKFGTDGWRAGIADGFDFENLERVSQATFDVIKKNAKSRLILIGYDHRFLSDQFAQIVAEVAAGNGFKVELTDQPVTSPTISFHAKSRKAGIGVMITASHNPFTFNGFKLKGSHGGSVDPELTATIEDHVDVNTPQKDIKSIKKADFIPPYVKWLKKWVPQLSLSKIKGPVLFDSMHGTGGKIFEKIFSQSKQLTVLRKEPDPFFGGKNPEPIEENLQMLKETVVRKKAAVGLAVDGDGDRIGLIDDKGHYIPPHTVMPLILQHLIVNRKLKGKVVQTVSMGYLPQRIAQKNKLQFLEVPVGYKHVASHINQGKVLMGGEESGGFGVGLWSPERDGLLCSLLILELMAKTKKPLSQLIESLHEEYGESHFKRVDFKLKQPVEKQPWTENIVKHIGPKIVGHPVKQVNSLDGVRVILEDDSWVLMRPSGTEPLIRTYAEASSAKIVSELLTEAERLVHIGPPRAPRGKAKSDSKKARKIRVGKP